MNFDKTKTSKNKKKNDFSYCSKMMNGRHQNNFRIIHIKRKS